ncbi:hypothetical protein SVAN01_04884 [Stagonosporopsis vannaccii]|nr:hypothetical protein SVAN01_04884 [Stagonosporopsis vannaccii]
MHEAPPQAAPTSRPREGSAANLTESYKSEATPTPPQSDNLDAVDESSAEDDLGKDSSLKDLTEHTFSADQHDTDDFDSSPIPKAPQSTKKRPRSVNCEDLDAEHLALTNKRRMLEFKLRRLGYNIPRPGSSGCTHDWTKKPTSIDGLWRAIQELRSVNCALEREENHSCHIARARRDFSTRLPRYQARCDTQTENASTTALFGPCAGDAVLPAVGWNGDGEARAMHTTARRYTVHPLPLTTAATEGQQRAAYGMANWPHAPYTPTPAIAPQHPLIISKRRRAYKPARLGTIMGAESLTTLAQEKPVGNGLLAGDGRRE